MPRCNVGGDALLDRAGQVGHGELDRLVAGAEPGNDRVPRLDERARREQVGEPRAEYLG